MRPRRNPEQERLKVASSRRSPAGAFAKRGSHLLRLGSESSNFSYQLQLRKITG